MPVTITSAAWKRGVCEPERVISSSSSRSTSTSISSGIANDTPRGTPGSVGSFTGSGIGSSAQAAGGRVEDRVDEGPSGAGGGGSEIRGEVCTAGIAARDGTGDIDDIVGTRGGGSVGRDAIVGMIGGGTDEMRPVFAGGGTDEGRGGGHGVALTGGHGAGGSEPRAGGRDDSGGSWKPIDGGLERRIEAFVNDAASGGRLFEGSAGGGTVARISSVTGMSATVDDSIQSGMS